MKTPNAINKYYSDRLLTAERLAKKKLNALSDKQSLEYARLEMKLTRKLEIQKKKIETDRKKKLKALETGVPVVKKVKERTNSRYKTKADWYFSRIIRARDCFDHNGIRCNYCCTTKKILPLLELQCWHYITRKTMILRYDYYNCLPQSPWANRREYLDKRLKKYFRKSLVEKYWEPIFLEVESKEHNTDWVDVIEMHNKFKDIYEKEYSHYYT